MTSIELRTLSDVRAELLHRLGDDEFKMRSISTRVLLRTGVSLANADVADETNPEKLTKVLAVLADMGEALR